MRDSPATDAPPTAACLNCGEAFGADRPRFCPACGQGTAIKPPTLLEFAQQFGGAYLSTEGALWRSLKLLVLRPGELTRQYLAGRRKHYVLPLRLYLTISVAVLLMLRVASSLDPDAVAIAKGDGFDPRAGAFALDIGPGRLEMKDGRFICERLPAGLCRRIEQRVNLDAAGFQRELDRFGDRFVSNLGVAMFAVLPLLALCLAVLYPNRQRRYTEHLVAALHLQAFWFLAMVLALPGIGLLKAVALVAVPLHTWFALGRIYGGRRWPRLLRLAVLGAAYPVAMGLAMLAILVWAAVT
ncbi:DUF3667 domain-containing protein [Rhizobacter sp. Root404]|uniref:DUF3667 domain-containing protein n=1 Tax=Rhizobacter sp. Root404 TaxID=1736528 RepID=UPI0006F1FECD|nr:DUF3667 domain-containing protein [Rhizobacter sp. Root404]KQW38970.1 hypothetical protein ASC76_13530 [Rhizobacter sp. Root404]